MKDQMKYVCMFNNRVGNTYSKNIDDVISDAKKIVGYGYATIATIFVIKEDGRRVGICWIY